MQQLDVYQRSPQCISPNTKYFQPVPADVHWLMHGKSTDTEVPTKAWEGVIGRHRSTSRNTTMLRKLVAKIDT